MKKREFVGLAVVGLFFFLVFSLVRCDSAEPAPGRSNVKIRMMAEKGTSSGSLMSGRVATDTIVFSKALIGISELEFKTLEEDGDDHKDCDSTRMDDDDSDRKGPGSNDNEDKSGSGSHDDDEDDQEAQLKGDFVFDLISGTSSPNFEVTPGVYKKIEIKTAPILADGKSAFIAFDATQGSETFKVEFSTKAKMELELKQYGGFKVDSSAMNQILVLLKLNVLFAGIDFSQAVVDADGVIRINETSNTRLFYQIKGKLEESFEAGEDHNHDGKIDDHMALLIFLSQRLTATS